MNRYGSPLRYPGGKQRLAPFILDLMRANNLVGGHYAEPYAGGAGVAIHLLLTDQVEHVHLNDSSPAIYAFWRSLQRDPDEICRRIASASLTIEEWQNQRRILNRKGQISQIDLGFSLFYLNRCNRSGIPTAGVIGGLSQTGRWKMDARFPRNELIRRVEAIAARCSKMTVTGLDAEAFIRERIPRLPKKSLVYCDPPYYRQAKRLYLNYYQPADHARLAKIIRTRVRRPWIVSYDDVPEIRRAYSKCRCISCRVQYNAARAYVGTEIFFLSDAVSLPSRVAQSSLVLA